MATQTVLIVASSGWSSPTLKLFPVGTDAAATASVAASAGTEDPSLYSAAFTDVAAGRYRAVLFSGSTPVASDFVTIAAATATYPMEGMQSVPTTAEIKTALEADGSKLDHLWEMTEDDAGTRRLTTNALEQAPAGGGGGGDATEAKQDSILAALSGKVVKVTSRVINGTDIVSYIGDDDVGDDAAEVVIDDVGGVIRDKLQAASAVHFAGGLDSANEITGTINADNITHAGGRTTIPVEIPSTGKPTKANPSYEYHIKSVSDSAKEFVRIEGTIDLRPERCAL
ncbi:MAG: hypothetical protein Fues2KO_45620 [Fuerstiella sp.]